MKQIVKSARACEARRQLQTAWGLCLLGLLMVGAHGLGPGFGLSLQSVTAMVPIGIFLLVAGSALLALTLQELRAGRARQHLQGPSVELGATSGAASHLHLIRAGRRSGFGA